jgi:hypothetical protein
MDKTVLEGIFKQVHGTVEINNMLPYVEVNKENAIEVAEYMGFDVNSLYYNAGGFLHKVIYWKDEVYMPFIGEPVTILSLSFMREKERYQQVLKYFTTLKQKGDYEAMFSMMEKTIIIPLFNRMYFDIPDDKRYDIFIQCYVRSEYGFTSFKPEILSDVFDKRVLSSEWTERMNQFRGIASGDTITVYRGATEQSTEVDKALSWTLSRKTAKFFANRFGSNGTIHKKVINTISVMDYIDTRNESEVLIIPA